MSAISADSRPRVLLGAIAMVVVVGCSGAVTATPSPSPTATPEPTVAGVTPSRSAPPTPSPTWTTVSDGDLRAACAGTPIAGAAPYAGKVRPLVVITDRYDDYDAPSDLVSRSTSGVTR